MGSTRLPGKILEDLAGKTALEHCVERCGRARLIDDIVVATTDLPRDDVIVELCKKKGWRHSRGSQDDVLDRYYQAARAIGADPVVRVTSDCPVNDPIVLDELIERYRSLPDADYCSTSQPAPSFPLGITGEVIRFCALERSWNEDKNPAWREHVTPYIYRHPEMFSIVDFPSAGDYAHHRWTLDTPEDLQLIRTIFEHFQDNTFGWRDVLALIEAHPEWSRINAHVMQKTVEPG